MAWLIVLVYLLAGIFCLFAGYRRSLLVRSDTKPKWVWYILGTAMILLSLNKQLDLQILITNLGRSMAREGGWYAQRRLIQRIAVWGVSIVGLIGLTGAAVVLRRNFREFGLALIGCVLLGTFVVIRAASFYHVESLFESWPSLGNLINVGLELGGAGLLALGAYQSVKMRASES
jgi:hypothetical protein